MDKFMQYFKNLRIATKFIVWFLLISFVPLTVAIYISFTVSRRILKQEAQKQLSVIADGKAAQIEGYLVKQRKDGAALAYTSEIMDGLEKLSGVLRQQGRDTPDYRAAEREISSLLLYYRNLFAYDDILLFDPDGNLLHSAQGRAQGQSLYQEAMEEESELTKVFLKTKASFEVEVSGLEYDPQTDKTNLFVAIPVFKQSEFLGIVMAEVSNQGLYPFVRDHAGLGATGETIVVSKIGKDAVFLAPLRFGNEVGFKRKMGLGPGVGQDVLKALAGAQGSGITTDYRGRRVLAVWRYLPQFRLGVVVKMDGDEVFASAARLRNTQLKLGIFIFVMVVAVALLIARSMLTPIIMLTNVSKVIASGDLSARADVETGDEIGELAQSFNQMTDSLVEAKASVEQKKAQLEEQKRLLEEANKELDGFVYTVSHDLRAPLRGIDGLGSFLQQDYGDKLDAQGKEYLQKIRSSAERMKMLIDDLLKLSRIARIKNPYEDTDMNELVKSVAARLEFDMKKMNVEFVVAQDLPVLRCDRIKMEEAVFNLVSNAMKFSSKIQDRRPRVEVGYRDTEEANEFFVKDNGIGIEKKYHEEIFGIFRRLPGSENYEGTGAGLSIVKRVIDDHHGAIRIESEPGKGTTFFFTIPKKLAEKKKRLGEILVEDGIVSEDDIRKALEKQGMGE